MKRLISKENPKIHVNLLKDVGYILLLTVFFVGIILGSFQLKNVNETELQEYEVKIQQGIASFQTKEVTNHFNEKFWNGIKALAIFWTVGMSIVGAPVLVGYIGYKGYALGYTISTIVRMIGMKAGNGFTFRYLFFSNTVLIFIMMFLANWAIQLSKKFFEKNLNLKAEMLKYSVMTGIMAALWIGACLAEKFFLTTF